MADNKNANFVNRLKRSSEISAGLGNRKCMQDDDDGKFYCYKKIQGRWVQCDGIPYDTQEECEKALDE